MIGVFRERFFTFRMKLKMFITSSDHYLKYLAILFLVKASGLGDFVSQNPLFSYGAIIGTIPMIPQIMIPHYNDSPDNDSPDNDSP